MSNSDAITIADVARTAGVSVSTVSRILNGKQDVAPATRERVQQVIEDLGFIPHAQAKRLRAGKTHNIGLLFPLKYPGKAPYNSLETDFIIGAAAAAGERNFFFNLITNKVTKPNLLNLYRSAQVDGLVLMQVYAEDWRVDLLREQNYPFVMIGRCGDTDGLSFIDLDFEAAVLTAFDHLVALRHRRIGFIAIPNKMRERGYGPAMRGWAGYERACQAYSLTRLYREVSYDAEAIFQATLSLLDEQPDLTAIVTTHEFASLSIIQALTERGRCIPVDCSLVALMSEQIAGLTTPPVTHIDFPSYQMGYQAVDMLIRLLNGELNQPEQILISPRLIVRNSTTSLEPLTPIGERRPVLK